MIFDFGDCVLIYDQLKDVIIYGDIWSWWVRARLLPCEIYTAMFGFFPTATSRGLSFKLSFSRLRNFDFEIQSPMEKCSKTIRWYIVKSETEKVAGNNKGN